jgi:hypothetical protein
MAPRPHAQAPPTTPPRSREAAGRLIRTCGATVSTVINGHKSRWMTIQIVSHRVARRSSGQPHRDCDRRRAPKQNQCHMTFRNVVLNAVEVDRKRRRRRSEALPRVTNGWLLGHPPSEAVGLTRKAGVQETNHSLAARPCRSIGFARDRGHDMSHLRNLFADSMEIQAQQVAEAFQGPASVVTRSANRRNGR